MPKVERRLKYKDTPEGSITRTAARGGTYDSGAFVRVDGTRRMTADWDAGTHEIECAYFDADTAFYFGGVHILSATGTRNLFGGELAGAAIDAGTDNVYLGYGAGETSDDDSENVAIGAYAMNAADGSDDCVAIGYGAMENTTTADFSVAIGAGALNLNVDGGLHVAVGVDASGRAPTGVVVTEQRRGYRAPGGVLRFAEVVVSRPADSSPPRPRQPQPGQAEPKRQEGQA